MKVFRIENPDTMHGMWYKTGGVYDPYIFNLTEGICKDLPMEFHERYSQGNKAWYSAGKSVENMHEWFSARDAYELERAGYLLYEFDVEEYQVEPNQVIFTRQGINSQKVIPLNTIWNMNGVI